MEFPNRGVDVKNALHTCFWGVAPENGLTLLPLDVTVLVEPGEYVVCWTDTATFEVLSEAQFYERIVPEIDAATPQARASMDALLESYEAYCLASHAARPQY